jgi:excisionase family DNA binding protein
MLGISRSLAYELIASGELPSQRLGRRILVPISAIEAFIAGAVPKAGTPDRASR